MWDVEAVRREMATVLQAIAIQRCGHLPHEELPEPVDTTLLDCLKDW
jgi:haloacetate dehalogenase